MSSGSTFSGLVENYIQRVEESIERSGNSDSGLSSKVLKIPTMHQPAYLHMVNNLCSYEDVRHLHVGFWQGASLFACLENNPNLVIYANDIAATPEFLDKSTSLGFDGRYTPIIDRFENIDFSIFEHKINFLIYDADHSEESQYLGVQRWDPILDDVFILLVDDWNHYESSGDPPQVGTRRAIRDRGYEICREWIVNRHVGQGIFVIKKGR